MVTMGNEQEVGAPKDATKAPPRKRWWLFLVLLVVAWLVTAVTQLSWAPRFSFMLVPTAVAALCLWKAKGRRGLAAVFVAWGIFLVLVASFGIRGGLHATTQMVAGSCLRQPQMADADPEKASLFCDCYAKKLAAPSIRFMSLAFVTFQPPPQAEQVSADPTLQAARETAMNQFLAGLQG